MAACGTFRFSADVCFHEMKPRPVGPVQAVRTGRGHGINGRALAPGGISGRQAALFPEEVGYSSGYLFIKPAGRCAPVLRMVRLWRPRSPTSSCHYSDCSCGWSDRLGDRFNCLGYQLRVRHKFTPPILRLLIMVDGIESCLREKLGVESLIPELFSFLGFSRTLCVDTIRPKLRRVRDISMTVHDNDHDSARKALQDVG